MKLENFVKIDNERDVITIYGINYSGSLFRGLGLETPEDAWMKIIKREDGVLHIEMKHG